MVNVNYIKGFFTKDFTKDLVIKLFVAYKIL